MSKQLHTEKVSQNYEPRPGQMVTREFWIAYPDHVLALGSMEDRISRSWGRGLTEAEALADAERPEQ
jgi:hypothetical protein